LPYPHGVNCCLQLLFDGTYCGFYFGLVGIHPGDEFSFLLDWPPFCLSTLPSFLGRLQACLTTLPPFFLDRLSFRPAGMPLFVMLFVPFPWYDAVTTQCNLQSNPTSDNSWHDIWASLIRCGLDW
jgi:hypothetical protein